ncbi:molybdopterin-guanine dinucleotide biosynthesis protein B [Candidatus Bathyarchaeota archaeon]|nr:molybdopterin-guanine dinucleotide biosynthesis protein B [Candidatus Bathyarchaeota archaeon]
MFNRVIVAVIGSSNSGKTTAIEVIIEGLTKKGYNVASVKHISEEKFTIDTQGKDTWRYSKSGAKIVLSVAPKEIAIIKKTETKSHSLEKIISEISEETDIIIIEGFKNLVAENISIPKIVAIKNNEEMLDAIRRYKNVFGLIGYNLENKETKIPFINPLSDKEKLVELVLKKVEVLIERKRKYNQRIAIKVNEVTLPLGNFVQEIIRNSVLAMVSSLKGVKIIGEEKVLILIKRLER